MSINYLINQLIKYGVKEGLIEEYDMIYCANKLIDIFKVNTFEFEETEDIEIHILLDKLCDYAYKKEVLPVKLEMELMYVEKMGLSYDCQLVLRTIATIFGVLIGKNRFKEQPELEEAKKILAGV